MTQEFGFKIGKMKTDYNSIGKLLKSKEVADYLQSEADKQPQTKEVITKGKYKYTGQKTTKPFTGKTRVGIYINWRLNGSKLTEALEQSSDSRSRRLGHIRKMKGGRK